MEYRIIGRSGLKASVIGLGTWAIGGWKWGGTDVSDSISAIHCALDRGINFIDTAAVYGFGLSEEIVGKAISGRRDKVVVATKCGIIWHEKKGRHYFDSEDKSCYKYLGSESIRYELEQSLRRLGTDYIDLYQTHWQDPTSPIEETMGELVKLKQEGKIRSIGVSNASVADMKEYEKFGQLDSDQESYNMLDRKRKKDNLSYCAQRGIAFLAYSPLARGLLTGRLTPERVLKDGDHRKDDKRFSVENRRKILALLEKLEPIAKEHNATMSKLAIAWALVQPGVTHVLCGARNPLQMQENAKASNIKLSSEEISKINVFLEQSDIEY